MTSEVTAICEALESFLLEVEMPARQVAAACESLRFELANIRETGQAHPPVPPQEQSHPQPPRDFESDTRSWPRGKIAKLDRHVKQRWLGRF